MKALMASLALVICAGVVMPAQQQDFSQVEIKTTKIGTNFYMLEGSGGTIGVLPGPDGVFMVDTQFAPLGDKIVAAIKADLRRPHPLPGQHARAPGSHRRQREHRQARRDDLRAREPARRGC